MEILEISEYKTNYAEIAETLEGSKARIITVSKAHPVEALQNAYSAGLRVFGENYVQEMVDKYNTLNEETRLGIEWHFIGHLQTNKVKYIAPFVDYIHSVYKPKLANEIDKRAKENNRKIKVLLQVNISGEDSKSGCDPNDAEKIIAETKDLDSIEYVGLMAISGLESSDDERRQQFASLRELRDTIEMNLDIKLPELSMGMSSDYLDAIKEGATMVRIGTSIFGKREYTK